MKATAPDGAKVELAIAGIVQNPKNPGRGPVGPDAPGLKDLAQSLEDDGLLQPIIVRAVDGGHMVVCGHRRLAAARLLGWETIPAIIRHVSEGEARRLALIENLQREDLSPIEEAMGYLELVEGGKSVAEIAASLHRSRSTVAGRLALLDLPEDALGAVNCGDMTLAVAHEIARLPGAQQREEATNLILASGNHVWDDDTKTEIYEPCTYRRAIELIRDEFLTDLAGAPFDPSDAELVPAAGSCSACPRRTGNAVDLFGDVVAGPRGADVCTYARCFAEKREANVEKLLAAAREDGLEVLKPAKAAKIFLPGARGLAYNAPYVECDATARSPVTGNLMKKTWRQALGKKAPGEVVAVSPTGKAVHLYPRAACEQVLGKKAPEKGAAAGGKSASRNQDSVDRRARMDRVGLAANMVFNLIAAAAEVEPDQTLLKIVRMSAHLAADGTSAGDEAFERRLKADPDRDSVELYVGGLSDAQLVGLQAEIAMLYEVKCALRGTARDDERALADQIEMLIGTTFREVLATVDKQIEQAGGEA